MEKKKILSTIKAAIPAFLLLTATSAFAQEKDKPKQADVTYQQLHSGNLESQQGLFADGIKLKMNLSVLEEANASREEFDINDIPADDLYGGIWNNSGVHTYGALKSLPDSFKIDLTRFTMPFEGRMTSNFGTRGRRYHYGVDLKVQVGDTIYAAFDGKVRMTKYERRGYGYYVVMRHVNGLETVYGHLSKFLVEEDQFVKTGEPIGLGGNTGRSTGSHLHFETRFLGKPINPNFIVDFENFTCHKDEFIVSNASFHKTTQSSRKLVTSPNYKVPTPPTSVAKSSEHNKFVDGEVKYYRIKSGDTLGAIARRNGTTINQLCKLNNITTKTTLRIGKSLRIS